MKLFNENGSPVVGAWVVAVTGLFVLAVALLFGLFACTKAFGRQQRLWDEQNQVTINNIRIQQQVQLIKVEQQKAEIRVVEAGGIAEAQRIINATLTDKYLQHEAISAQREMANSPNHTTVYIPSGQNGIPIVRTEDAPPQDAAAKEDE